jgi:gliding motility-associated-like protein
LGVTCSGAPKTYTITVNPAAQVDQPVSHVVCNGDAVAGINFTTTNTGGTTSYSWTNSNTTIGLTANGSGSIPPFTASNLGSLPIVANIVVTTTYANAGGSCTTTKTFTITINPSPKATITGQNSFNVCQNATQPTVTFTGSNGTAPYTFSYQIGTQNFTVTSLGTSNSATISIPTSTAGNYTVTLLSVQDSSSSTCTSNNITLPNTAFVTVKQVGTIIPNNQALVSQTLCQNTLLATPIVFAIGGSATNAYVTNLPNGLSGSFASGIFTISGTPLVSGVFNYVVHTSGSSCNSTYSGTITVNSNDSISLLPISTLNQSVCDNVTMQPIVFNLGGGSTGGIVTFTPSQPIGITWGLTGNVITISGTSNSVGTYTYTVQSYGICGTSTLSGNITIIESPTITLVSGNPNPTVCEGSSTLPIWYSIIPSSATMIVTGLPTGVTFNAATGIITGTPSQSGTFSYSISSTTTCGNTLTGVITVSPVQSISYVSGNTNQVACQYASIDPINFVVSSGVNAITITPAFPAGISYSLINGVLTISGTPTSPTSLAQNYTLTTQGTCGPQATYSVTFDIRPEATITLITGSGPINQAVCQSSAIIPIRFTIGGGATDIVIPTLPAGLTLTLDPLTGIYTIQGNPLVNGIFNFPITTTGCPKTLFITISNVNSSVGITLTSAVGTDNQTLCQTNFNSPISPITYTIIGATNMVVNGLPIGVTAVFSPTTGQLIISGTSTEAGIFNYTITSLPCSVVKAGVIRVSTPMFITNEVVTNISCSGSNDGAIAVTIIGGVAFNGLYAVHWSGPNGFQQNQTTITGLQAGDYVLTGTDAIGCPIPTMTYTVLPAQPIAISLQSSTNVNCNGVLGCANLNITGGSGIYTLFTLQYLDPSSQTLVTITPANNNYFNICNLRAGLYYLTVKDSKNCTTTPYLFTIYDYSSLSIESITMDDTLCLNTPGKIRIKVNSLDTNLSFYYNSVLVPAISLGNSLYELSIDNPTVPTGIIKVKNGQDCWVTTSVSTAIISPDFEFTSNDFINYGYYSVNGSVQFTNLVNMASIPAEYAYIVWDFGDNTPFKVFYNPDDLLPNPDGENFETVFHTYTTNGIYQVTLTVYNHFGCSRKVTKTIIIGSGATMMLPTIFTPNGDGINDMFRPSLMGLKDVTMYIYDGWGNVVYEVSSEVSLLSSDWGWNGIEKGQTEPMNNEYRYYIIATTINDKKIEKEGRFLLVK